MLAVATLTAVTLLASGASAQRLSFGVVVGGYGNSDFDSQYAETPGFNPSIVESESGGRVVGPTLDIRLSPRLSVGLEALYKPLRYRAGVTFQNGLVIGYAPAAVITWQFPALARYRLALGELRPFVEAGPSFRTTGNLNSSNPSHLGVSVGLGAETQWRRLRLTPRVRYTRWAEDPSRAVRTRADQLEFLVGFSHATASDAYPLGRRISFGAVVGSTVSADFAAATSSGFGGSTYRTASVHSVPLGPLVELSLSPRFSIEANAITRSIRGVTELVDGDCPWAFGCSPQSFSSGGLWEFPMLVKYRLTTGSWRPFVALGPSFRLPKETAGAWLSSYGATAGVGVEIHWKRIKISPVVRFTHWGADRPRVAGAQVNSGVFRNQAQVFVGVSF